MFNVESCLDIYQFCFHFLLWQIGEASSVQWTNALEEENVEEQFPASLNIEVEDHAFVQLSYNLVLST